MPLRIFPIDESPGYIIHCMDMQMKLSLTRAFKLGGFDITPEQWGVLSRLWEIEGLNQRELAEKVSKDRPNITRILILLEKNGFIKREPDPNDKRSLRVYLTENGKNLQSKLTPIASDLVEKCFQNLPEEKIEDFMAVHRQILKNLTSIK